MITDTPLEAAGLPAESERAADLGPPNPWLACVYPMMAFLVVGLFEPTQEGGGIAGSLGISQGWYPLLYALRVALTIGLLVVAWPSLRGWLGRATWWPPLVGLALVVPWIWLSTMQRDGKWLSGDTGRVGFDPFGFYGEGAPMAWTYIALRFVGLAIVVPIVEELFLRGFLMRYVIDENFWNVPFGRLTLASTAACLVYAVATHPAEAVAALAWFAVMSGVASATRRPIDVILAHAATNLALGAYVIATKSWWLM